MIELLFCFYYIKQSTTLGDASYFNIENNLILKARFRKMSRVKWIAEKILKALYVQTNNNQLPPKTHNLVKLARLSKLNLSMEQEILLDEINDFNLEVRYPQYKNEFFKKCTKKFSVIYYQKINEMMIWLKSRIE